MNPIKRLHGTNGEEFYQIDVLNSALKDDMSQGYNKFAFVIGNLPHDRVIQEIFDEQSEAWKKFNSIAKSEVSIFGLDSSLENKDNVYLELLKKLDLKDNEICVAFFGINDKKIELYSYDKFYAKGYSQIVDKIEDSIRSHTNINVIKEFIVQNHEDIIYNIFNFFLRLNGSL